jgi:acetyl-CoA/propionyl-CoA carboxylase biotin carboxyl carrier protein
MFDRVLVANRGEIARRVVATLQSMEIETVTVHASDDARQPHVRRADRAVDLDAKDPDDTYMNGPRLVEIALEHGCDAVHPGYGFLSENANFAARVQNAGLAWIGPDPKALELLGDKARALDIAESVDAPITPGSEGTVDTVDEARAVVEELGTPSVLKAVHGGGGMGMRSVNELDEVPEAFEQAQAQAQSAFGSPELMVERWWENPRHVEVQIAADKDQRTVHLFERECSLQRRRQKLVEEAPAPAVDEDLRDAVTTHAVRICQKAGVHALATVEFLVTEAGPVFNEVNPRLQVEHPVTEAITGPDLVEWQTRLAAGQPLPRDQSEIQRSGHAIEARVNVEDPLDEFAPAPGPVTHLHVPNLDGVRVDDALVPGSSIPPHYDSLAAKVIGEGANRDEAIDRTRRGLARLRVGSRPTTARFLRYLLDVDEVRAGEMTTGTVDASLVDAYRERVHAAMARLVEATATGNEGEVRLDGHEASWMRGDGQILVDGRPVKPAGKLVERGRVELDGVTYEGHAAPEIAIQTGRAAGGTIRIESPIPGTVADVEAAEGDELREGDTLVVVEAMKMKNQIGAPRDGTVDEVLVDPDEDVDQGQPLARLDTE